MGAGRRAPSDWEVLVCNILGDLWGVSRERMHILAAADGCWADYEPARWQINEVGWRRAYEASTRCSKVCTKLRRSLRREAWPLIRDLLGAGYDLVLVGASNGCLPAVHVAAHLERHVGALVLLSGVPVDQQLYPWQWRAAPRFPVVMTHGSQERFFGGPEAFVQAASTLRGVIVEFNGQHCNEGEDTLRQVQDLLRERLRQ